MNAETIPTSAIQYDLEITIEATKARVWQSITQEVDAWWLPDFHILGADSTIQFDCQAGGQLREVGKDGSSLLWYTVHMCVPEDSLYLIGHVAADFGGPATTMLSLKLSDNDGSTTLKVADAIYGRIDQSTATSLKSGWAQLFGDGLKRHAQESKG